MQTGQETLSGLTVGPARCPGAGAGRPGDRPDEALQREGEEPGLGGDGRGESLAGLPFPVFNRDTGKDGKEKYRLAVRSQDLPRRKHPTHET